MPVCREVSEEFEPSSKSLQALREVGLPRLSLFKATREASQRRRLEHLGHGGDVRPESPDRLRIASQRFVRPAVQEHREAQRVRALDLKSSEEKLPFPSGLPPP